MPVTRKNVCYQRIVTEGVRAPPNRPSAISVSLHDLALRQNDLKGKRRLKLIANLELWRIGVICPFPSWGWSDLRFSRVPLKNSRHPASKRTEAWAVSGSV